MISPAAIRQITLHAFPGTQLEQAAAQEDCIEAAAPVDVERKPVDKGSFGPQLPTIAERQQMVDATRAAIALLEAATGTRAGRRNVLSAAEVGLIGQAALGAFGIHRQGQVYLTLADRLQKFEVSEAAHRLENPRLVFDRKLGPRTACRRAVMETLQGLLSDQTAQRCQSNDPNSSGRDLATPDEQFRALSFLRDYAAGSDARRDLAAALHWSWRTGAPLVQLAAGAGRSLPPAWVAKALAGNVRLLQIQSLEDSEVTDEFVASLEAFGADALLLDFPAVLPARVCAAATDVYLSRSPHVDVSTAPVLEMLRDNETLRIVGDDSIKGIDEAARQFPGRIDAEKKVDAEWALRDVGGLRRWADGLSDTDCQTLRHAPPGSRKILRQALRKCDQFFAQRPEFVENMRLLMREMAADAGFMRDACGQIQAWAPGCADDWISCISSVLSSRAGAGPITGVEQGALRILLQSLLEEANRIALMRDPTLLPPGAWDNPRKSIATETALMLRQAALKLMKNRFALEDVRHVPQLYPAQSAVNEDGADAVMQGIVEREKQDGFPLATQLARDSRQWKQFVATLPGVQAELDAALERSGDALDAGPEDEMAVFRSYEKEIDAIRARPLVQSLTALV